MDLPAIVQTGARVLRGRAGDVPASMLGSAELDRLVATMVDVMRQAPGVGLAAPQIGVPLRVIVLEDREELFSGLTDIERAERGRVPFPLRALVNPEVRPLGEARATFFEGCLSVAGFVALVDRSAEVAVEAVDARGERVAFTARGWPARILQHEVDHLDGTLYIDRMLSRSFATVTHARELYAGRPIAEIRRALGV